MSRLGLMVKFGTQERHRRKRSLQFAVGNGGRASINNDWILRVKNWFRPWVCTLPLVALALQACCKLWTKGVINIFILKQSINTGSFKILVWAAFLKHTCDTLTCVFSESHRVIPVSFWHWLWLGSHPCTSVWISFLSSLPSLNWKNRYSALTWLGNHCGY